MSECSLNLEYKGVSLCGLNRLHTEHVYVGEYSNEFSLAWVYKCPGQKFFCRACEDSTAKCFTCQRFTSGDCIGCDADMAYKALLFLNPPTEED